jgi:phospholipid-translocating P-type ATPase (flippase)
MDPRAFCSNTVTTSQYTPFDFLPKFLFFSFLKLANAYFLMVSVMQMVPEISNTNGVPTTAPVLALILFVDAIFQVMEDLERHRADAEANNRKAYILNASTNSIEETRWLDVKVGDIIKIYNKNPVPADVLLMVCASSTNNPDGICNVETKELDGETNLKPRLPLSAISERARKGDSEENTLLNLRAEVKCELPNRFISKFSATCEVQTDGDSVVAPVELANVLLRGSTLHSVEYCYALVLNTGVDTKIMQNMGKAEMKQSTIDKKINTLIIWVVLLLCVMCSCGAIGSSAWNHTNMGKTWYFKAGVGGEPFWVGTDTGWEVGETVVTFFYFFLITSQFVSVSLYVSMTMVKFLQRSAMQNLLSMYHEETDTPMKVRTMSLNDELGVISHVFSDKTGTLTENVMEFRKCSIGGRSYGHGTTEIGLARMKREGVMIPAHLLGKGNGLRAPYVNFDGPELLKALELERNDSSGVDGPVSTFFLHLSLCHNIILDDNNEWSAQSPDELALVAAADFFGFKFAGEVRGLVTIRLNDGTERQFQKLDELEFTSARKRMSVIVRDVVTKKIIVLTKGADNVMGRRMLDTPTVTQLVATTYDQLTAYGADGLRTLVIASKDIEEEEYAKWKANYLRVTTDLGEIEKKKEDKPNKINEAMDSIETGLVLIGATAIEDKLQDGVPQCIADLATAGIATWVLTGDKEETAINIAHACLLLNDTMCTIVINLKKFPTLDAIRNELVGRARQIESFKATAGADCPTKFALVIDGDALQMVMAVDAKGNYTGCQAALLRYSHHCIAVVACRCAPSQKAEIVRLIRTHVSGCRTLSIGDGANDVPMIQEAHVGVGISGHEGLQAVNSSDFAIAQFRFLKDLLLVQGRNNYRRISMLVLYLFYKNIMMVSTQFWFTIANTGVSGQKFSPEFGTQAFNAIWTAFPILILGVFDKDARYNTVVDLSRPPPPSHVFPLLADSDKASHAYPQMYRLGIENYFFSRRVHLQWLFDAAVESIALTFIALEALKNSGVDGVDAGLWMTGAHTFTLVVIVANLKLLFIQHQWNWWMVLVWFVFMASWWPCCAIGSMVSVAADPGTAVFAPGWVGLWGVVNGLPVFWLTLLVVPPILLLPQLLRSIWYDILRSISSVLPRHCDLHLVSYSVWSFLVFLFVAGGRNVIRSSLMQSSKSNNSS